MPMNSIYRALLRLMIVPVVLNVSLTSGTADKTVVLANGAKKEQKLMMATITSFRLGDILS